MLSEIRGRKIFGTTVALWLLFVFTTFLDPAWCAPQQLFDNGLSRRTDDSPGLGVEVEMGKIVIAGKEKLTAEQKKRIKGAQMIPIGFAGAAKTDWELTADIGPLQVMPEAIVDGRKNKLRDRRTKGIGEEIFKFFVWLSIPLSDPPITFIADSSSSAGRLGAMRAQRLQSFDHLGPWSVKWPRDAPVNLAKFRFSPQVTSAMPLGAILDILSDTKSKTHNPLASTGALDGSRIKILTKKNFKSFSKIEPNDITPDFLGYFSLLTSYCVLADFSNPIEGPKRLLPIMPRTDFVAQYIKFIEPKLKNQLSDKKTSLYDIVEKVSGAGPKLAKETFKWTTGVITNIDDDWIGKAENLKTGTLEVEKFLNYMQGYDKVTKKTLTQMDLLSLMDKVMRYNQIGSLGSRMETILGTNKLVPIFEFRELALVLGSALGTTMGLYEDKVIEYHKHFAGAV
ncbi:MAG: hypothetical protein M1821_009714 [Bathelium mastoideum]|nr:MAG: hypothetical protein M1821_009714 [Bathelium mastoideum]